MEPLKLVLNLVQESQKSELEKTPESVLKAFSGVKISEWLPVVDDVRTEILTLPTMVMHFKL